MDSHRRLTAEHVAARALVESATFGDAAPKILEAICEALGWEYGALWRIDQEADLLRCVDTWRASTADFPEFNRASREMTFSRGVGLPGRVWETGQPSWIHDVGPRPQLPSRDHRGAREPARGLRVPNPPARRRSERHGVLQPRDPRT